MKITVKVYEKEQEQFSHEFTEGTYTMGRGDLCDLVLENDNVSRSHVEIRITESTVYLTNISTSNKIFIAGKAIETVELSSGNQFDVGPYRILVLFGSQIHAEPSRNISMDDEVPGVVTPVMNEMDIDEPLHNEIKVEDGPGFAPLEDPLQEAEDAEEPEPAPLEDPGPAVLEAEPDDSALPSQPQSEGSLALSISETQVHAKPLVAKLIFQGGARNGEELLLETYEVTFGRSKKADIYIDDDKLSRVHAKITRMGMGYRLVDLNSRNGTYVNGMRVLEHPLNSYDVIGLGRSKIKFLIHDIMAQEDQPGTSSVALSSDQTASVQLTPSREAQIIELQQAPHPDMGQVPPVEPPGESSVFQVRPPVGKGKKASPLVKMLLAALVALGILYYLNPTKTQKSETKKVAETKTQPVTKKADADTKVAPLPPSMPQEYFELSEETQRALEGHYRSAIRAADRTQFDEATFHMQKIHELVPYYKQSRDLYEVYARKLKEQQIAQAEEKAKRDEKQDLAIYLEEGLEYLKLGDFDRAAESFNSAIVVDPNNTIAQQGLRAAELKIRDVTKVPPELDPEMDKRKQVIGLFQKAVAAFANKGYTEAIATAEQIRKIELMGDTQYLSEAKQIIDRARMLQKEEFEPFLIQAKEKYAEADYNASRDLCEEMVKRDPAYDEAQECLLKARRQLNRLAKEAYVHGYILESMNKIDEAKQYWLRARNYVRKGDDYYDKVNKKLEFYQ